MAPFVPLCLSFCSGILLGFEFQSTAPFFVALFCISFLIFVTLVKFKWLPKNAVILHILVIFLSLGALSIHERLGCWNKNRLETCYHEFDPVQVEITEVGASTSDWVKIVGRVERLFHHDKAIDLNDFIVSPF